MNKIMTMIPIKKRLTERAVFVAIALLFIIFPSVSLAKNSDNDFLKADGTGIIHYKFSLFPLETNFLNKEDIKKRFPTKKDYYRADKASMIVRKKISAGIADKLKTFFKEVDQIHIIMPHRYEYYLRITGLNYLQKKGSSYKASVGFYRRTTYKETGVERFGRFWERSKVSYVSEGEVFERMNADIMGLIDEFLQAFAQANPSLLKSCTGVSNIGGRSSCSK